MTATRTVKLHGGPMDGAKTIVSHDTAIANGEVYVWGGGVNRDHFVHALTAVRALPPGLPKAEQDLMREFLADPTPENLDNHLKDVIPDWRINAWIKLFTYGQVK